MNNVYYPLDSLAFFQVDIATGTVTTIAGTGEKGTDYEGGNVGTAQVCEDRC